MKPSHIVAAILASALVAAGLFVMYARRPAASDAPDRSGLAPAHVYADWEAYFDDDARRDLPRRKVVFIGVDGAAWNILDPLIEKGTLPTFARLKREGSCGVLRSVEAYISPPAWVTMMTGYAPEKTGIYTFGHWDRAAREFLPLESGDTRTPSTWDIASHAGRRTAVLNVPMTYPVRDVNGIMVSGLMTPTKLHDRQGVTLDFGTRDGDNAPASFSPVLSAELEHSATRYAFRLRDTVDDGVTAYDKVVLVKRRLAHGPLEASDAVTHEFPVGAFSPWLEVNHLGSGKAETGWCRVALFPDGRTDTGYLLRFSHTFFAAGESEVAFTYPDTLAGALRREFGYYFPSQWLDKELLPDSAADGARCASYFYGLEDWDLFLYVFTQTDNSQHLDGVSPVTESVYRIIDRFLARLLERLPDDTVLVIASDHGFREYELGIDLNRAFRHDGLLSYTEGGEIDFERTLVFHNLWCLYFNHELLTLEELARRGVETPAGLSAQDALKRHLYALGRDLRAGRDGSPHPVEFSDVGPDAAGHAPDMYVQGGYDGYNIEFWNLKRPREALSRPLRPDERWHHTRDGVVMVHGDGVRRGVELPAMEIADIAPTLLYLLGAPTPVDMDGHVMAEAFTSDALSRRPHFAIEDLGDLSRLDDMSDAEREALEKNLRSLGYVR